MPRDLTPEQEMIRTAAGRTATEVLLPAAGETDENYLFNKNGIAALAKAGFMGMLAPAEFGGAGVDIYSYILALEEIAGVCASTALAVLSHSVALQAIARYGTDELKHRYLPAMTAGERLGAFAVHEAASGSVAGAIQTRAALDGDFYVVDGSKFFVTNGGVADYYVTLVRTNISKDPKEFSLLFIERQQDGLSTGKQDRRMGLNGTASTEVFFDGCRVSRKNLLGTEGGGLKAVVSLVTELALPGMSAIALGLAQAALEASIRYAGNRIIAGQPIAYQAAVQFLIAEMSTLVEAMRGMMELSLKERTPLAAFQAKLFIVEKALQVTDMALQVHGGHGYTKEMPVERYYRDARGLKLHFMTPEILKANIGKSLLGIT
ncbi:MAG: acyl-CoA dehydrogenase family protein [Eubacteriales bacterium]